MQNWSPAFQFRRMRQRLKKKKETIHKVSHTSYQHTVDSEVHDLIKVIVKIKPLQAVGISTLHVD